MEEKIKPQKLEQKKSFFGKIFGKKDEELQKELEDLEEVKVEGPKPKKGETEPIKDIYKIKLPELKFEDEVDITKAQEEIKESIESLKEKKRPSIVSGLFKKKEKIEWKIETPEVMPRTFDKIDYVEDIEEMLHKARLLLMDFKFDDAKRAYLEIMRMYSSLDPKDKSKVYNDVRDLYYERKSAEKFASK